MKSDNIIYLTINQEKNSNPEEQIGMLSEDLRVAIDILIQRLRDHDTIKQVG